MAIGALASLTTGGTYAIFRNEETNGANLAASGTLTLSDQVGTGTVCITQTASTNNNFNTGCSPLVTSSDPYYYPGTYVTANVTIKNTGSVQGKALYVWMPSTPGCTVTTTVSNAVDPNPGGGNPCASGGDAFYIQEDTDSTFTTAKECWYPGPPAAGACTTPTGGSLYDFSTKYYDYTANGGNAKLLLESLLGNGKLPPRSGIAAQSSRYFVIGIAIPAGASNNLQDEAANFPLTWHLESVDSIS
jgi:hypothetical protein